MKVYADQFDAHLHQAQSKGLAAVYLISGNVPLLVQEAGDRVRRLARETGFSERVVLDVDRHFNWQSLLQVSSELSLFATQRLIELRLPGAKPGDAGSKALQSYVDQVVVTRAEGGTCPNILLIIAGKIEKQAQKTKWFKALDKVGVIVQFWPIAGPSLQHWIDRRLRACGLQGDADALRLLAERSEGNLLACAQEIDKLQLLCCDSRESTITAADVISAVVDSARYDVFTLIDSALAGETVRVCRILTGLRGEGTDAVVILWALSREFRLLHDMATAMAGGASMTAQFSRLRVWDNRKSMVGAALQRLPVTALRAMLLRAARLDRVIKGQTLGNVWDELLQLSLMLAGVRPLKMVS